MNVVRALSVALSGIEGNLVSIEADISFSLPGFSIIGLPDASLAEAKERIRVAALNSGYPLSDKKITVNLAPATLQKFGTGYDLAIALCALAAGDTIFADELATTMFWGELCLDGRIRSAPGVIPAVLAAYNAGVKKIMVAKTDLESLSFIKNSNVIGVETLEEALNFYGIKVKRKSSIKLPKQNKQSSDKHSEIINQNNTKQVSVDSNLDLADVIGNNSAVDALIVSAVGSHNIFMVGTPGSGKTMLASRLPSILPDLNDDYIIKLNCILSLTRKVTSQNFITRMPPFVSPHHSSSSVALLGGGSGFIKPGAAVEAYGGVLFLDEATEFSSKVLDSLRECLETQKIVIHRAKHSVDFPADFQLVLAANPCPCGYFGSKLRECECSPNTRKKYMARISGPLRDRIDITMQLYQVNSNIILNSSNNNAITSKKAKKIVIDARNNSYKRLKGTPWRQNARVAGSWLRSVENNPKRTERKVIDDALHKGLISMRGYDKILRVAWSIADIQGENKLSSEHINKAFFYRRGYLE